MGSGTSKGHHIVSSGSVNKKVVTMEAVQNVNDGEIADNTRGIAGNEERKGSGNQGIEGEPVNQETDNKDNEPAVKEAVPVLTPEEIHTNTMNDLRTGFESLKDLGAENYLDSTGYYNMTVRNMVLRVYKAYFRLKNNLALDIIVKHRLAIGKLLLENKMVELMCEIIMYSYDKKWENDEKKIDVTLVSPFTNSILNILNFSDASEEVAIAVVDCPGFLELLKRILIENEESHLNGTQKALIKKVTKWAISILHNVSMRENNISRLRSLDYTAVLQPYLKVSDEMLRINILASLAAIIDEKESEIISANQGVVVFLLEVLRKAQKTNIRRHNGWSCQECCLTVRMLARNDANKKLLVEVGALELLVESGKTGNEGEQCESVGAIWALAFDEENGKKIVESKLGAVDLLLELKSSPNAKLKRMCNGALWTLRNHLQNSEKYKEIGQALTSHSTEKRARTAKKRRSSQKDDDAEDEGHIMISYQWADQPTLIKIRDRLKGAGHKVWMDIDQMGGSTLQSMADAVEGAKIILMCMSQKYKNSPNCRAEAEYAFQKQKKIVPLKMERGYMPDGWLGFICGAKLFYEFSGKYPFEDKMVGLLKELTIMMGRQSQTGEITPETASVAHHPPTVVTSYDNVDSSPGSHPSTMTTSVVSKAVVKTVRSWTNSDVQKWIEQNDLKSCGLTCLTGGEIALLMALRHESPDFFFKCLQDMLKVKDLLTLSKIVWAVTDLAEST